MDQRFLRNEMLWGREGQKRLAASHVILFGLGGVGSYAAECLARSGIGELTLVDSDTVSVTNINRQLEALTSTVGMPKADAVAARIRDINPNAVLHPIQDLYDAAHRDLFFPAGCHYDYIVDAIDLVSCKLDPTQLRLADISETYGCPLARVMRKELRNRGIHHQKVVFSPEEPAPTIQLEAPPPGRRSVPASNPWVPAAAGLLLGSAVVRDILEKERESLC